MLREWIERLRAEAGDGFPEKVTAFRPEMAVHGRYGKPCPVCGTPVQRIVYAENEANYCPTLPDRRPAARRPRALAAAQGGLAEDARGAGEKKERARVCVAGRRPRRPPYGVVTMSGLASST